MVREPTSSEIRSRNKLVEPEQERSMDRSSILRASTNNLKGRLTAGLFNMSRTLSIDKIGPGPGFLGQALPLSQPSCGDLGVSFRRSSLQFNIRPWRISALGNPLLRLGLPRRNDSLCTRVAPAALAKKETGVRPNGLGFGRRMGWIALCRRGLP